MLGNYWDADKAEEMGKPEGMVALADAIKNNGALTSLNLAENELGPQGAAHVAEAIKGHVSALRFD